MTTGLVLALVGFVLALFSFGFGLVPGLVLALLVWFLAQTKPETLKPNELKPNGKLLPKPLKTKPGNEIRSHHYVSIFFGEVLIISAIGDVWGH